MRKIRYRIALLIGGTVLAMLLIIMAVFNCSITRRIAEQADLSLKDAVEVHDLSEKAEEAMSFNWTLYAPEQILVTDDKEQVYSPKEKEMIRWSDKSPVDQTVKAVINGNTYYIRASEPEESIIYSRSFSISEESDENVTGGVTYITDDDISTVFSDLTDDCEVLTVNKVIAYVDITGELEMIRQINIIFLLSALGIGLFGVISGFILGKKLEQNQLVQKQFFENTSHELKTPLTAIRGYAEGMSKGVITDYEKTGKVISEQTEKMSSLVEEILCMAKIESGSVKPVKEQVDVPEFLEDCLMPFEGTVMSRNLKVDLDLKPMTISADPAQFEHAITNLITNALKYARTEIRISCGNGLICIENDSENISDDLLKNLFERFFTGRDGNTGIGLSLARDYINLHGWNINAERSEKGIRFIIRCKASTRP